jgi:cytochrome c5
MKYLLVMTTVAALTLSVSVSSQEGKAVYDKACTVCHSMGVAGAPKAHDTAAWGGPSRSGHRYFSSYSQDW